MKRRITYQEKTFAKSTSNTGRVSRILKESARLNHFCKIHFESAEHRAHGGQWNCSVATTVDTCHCTATRGPNPGWTPPTVTLSVSCGSRVMIHSLVGVDKECPLSLRKTKEVPAITTAATTSHQWCPLEWVRDGEKQDSGCRLRCTSKELLQWAQTLGIFPHIEKYWKHWSAMSGFL